MAEQGTSQHVVGITEVGMNAAPPPGVSLTGCANDGESFDIFSNALESRKNRQQRQEEALADDRVLHSPVRTSADVLRGKG